jgi:hypothetical protein
MKKPSTFEVPVAKNSPSATERSVVIVLAFPGKLDSGHATPFGEATVKTALYRDELKLTHALPVELDEGRDHKVQVFTTPELHLGDAPAPDERVRGL